MTAIATDLLTKFYGSHRGIEDVTMAVEEGEVFGFLGPNGAGKTTTIRTLLDLLHPDRGQCPDLRARQSRRDSVAIRTRIRQSARATSATERPPPGGRPCRCSLACAGSTTWAGAETLAERFRADLERPLGHLSRGNRQKIGLILAIFHEPELLILDEPTSGLDPLMQEEFLSWCARNGSAAVLCSSPPMSSTRWSVSVTASASSGTEG